MDKRSEQTKDCKELGDDDIGVHSYHKVDGGKREQLNGLWGVASEEVVGLPQSRLITNCYTKREGWKQKYGSTEKEKPSLIDEIMEGGPPLMNISKPHRVF